MVALQVGVVQVGQAFPFWVRQQTVLQLKVSTALPASLVRLAVGAEVAIAPRPRRTLAQQKALLPGASSTSSQSGSAEDQADTWLRLQVDILSLLHEAGKTCSSCSVTC